ncbi:MAG: hypothetical protein KJN98_01530, partial [Pontiella sp.]|nr:hypothetical protein [Pontiella sp.]
GELAITILIKATEDLLSFLLNLLPPLRSQLLLRLSLRIYPLLSGLRALRLKTRPLLVELWILLAIA